MRNELQAGRRGFPSPMPGWQWVKWWDKRHAGRRPALARARRLEPVAHRPAATARGKPPRTQLPRGL